MTLALPKVAASYRAIRVWQRHRDVFLNIWWSEVIWGLVEPVITLAALGLGLGEFVEIEGEGSYLDFVAPGLLAVFPMWAASAEAGWGSYFRMENLRTFEAMLATPLSVDDVTTGEVGWAATRGVISSIYILAVIAAFGTVQSLWALLVPLVGVVAGFLFGAVSLSYTAIARSISSLNYFFAVYITPQFWLSGAFFPLDKLPSWVGKAAWWAPASHAANAHRALVTGDIGWGLLADVAWMALAAFLFYLLALALMRRRLIR